MKENSQNEKDQSSQGQVSQAIPEDIVEATMPAFESVSNLFDYFFSNDEDKIIRSWVARYNKNQLEAFCELLTLIMQIAGKKVEITPEYIEGNLQEYALTEFQEGINEGNGEIPLDTFLKDKNNNKLQKFWKQMSNTMISCGALYSNQYHTFRRWLPTFNSKCLIRSLRISSSFCIFELLRSLATSLSSTDFELERLRTLESTDTISQQIDVLEHEAQFYTSASNDLFQNFVIVRTRDVDPFIRNMSITLITDLSHIYPKLFADVQKLNYIGRATYDQTHKNRKNALKCLSQIFNDLPADTTSEISERYIGHIIELCDDKDNSVSSMALECLYVLSEKGMIGELDCTHIFELLCDDSKSVRLSASKFVTAHYFKSDTNDLTKLVEFSSKFNSDDLPYVISTLYPKVKCIRQFDKICEMMMNESDDKTIELLSHILLISSERTVGKIEKIPPESDKRIRKLTLTLVKQLPKMIRAFQSENETVIHLIEASRLLDLDTISDNSCEHLYQQLLGEIRDIFMNNNDKNVYTSSIVSLYELSLGNHQLSSLAKEELNRLAVDCTKIEDTENDCTIGKFVAATRLIDVSDNNKLRDQILKQITDSKSDSYIANCIECLQYFYKWDIKRIRLNPEMIGNYMDTFNEYLQTFVKHLKIGSLKVKEESFKALSTLFSLSPFLRVNNDENEEEKELMPIEDIDLFYNSFHKFLKKSELFEYAARPIQIHSIPISYSAHLMIYYGNEYMQVNVKALWKELAPYKLIDGSQLFNAFIESDIDENALKISARFIIGKFDTFQMVKNWFENGENDKYLIVIVQFLFSISPDNAIELSEIASERFEPILQKIANKEKPTQKMVTGLMSSRKETRKRANDNDDIEEEPAETFISRQI
ncbi:Sister-chromatid cohesion protein 3 [Histomonas meleagridis]|uniref:Sister-chromatid cohesion protein 3 n=1 Tax=Histomonas meleagridis TaxID=135588 RepID=UPI003559D112|nr:Sister-chromatid cohesion protein 3 [Histomonas meleagridis]KAH0802875.1 Sister-chromatid cohesion protein 3 [Histomonas meleagridis]